jgi:hypothetical protein
MRFVIADSSRHVQGTLSMRCLGSQGIRDSSANLLNLQ